MAVKQGIGLVLSSLWHQSDNQAIVMGLSTGSGQPQVVVWSTVQSSSKPDKRPTCFFSCFFLCFSSTSCCSFSCFASFLFCFSSCSCNSCCCFSSFLFCFSCCSCSSCCCLASLFFCFSSCFRRSRSSLSSCLLGLAALLSTSRHCQTCWKLNTSAEKKLLWSGTKAWLPSKGRKACATACKKC